ncbi:hypothetical protein L218DRAFT_853643, partial [Marasmius fiardii PR-910]
YSQYKGIAVATPQKSGAPTVPAGGNGRAEIIVEDMAMKKHEDNEDDAQTSAFVNKPEPGRDIFAAEPVKDIKSSMAAQPQNEEKLISTVAKEEEKDKPKEKDSSTSTDDLTGLDPVHNTKKPEGPPEEADIILDKVAKDLYPEEANKD